jgi:hypothetical protein
MSRSTRLRRAIYVALSVLISASLILLLISGCDEFSLYDVLQPEEEDEGDALALLPASLVLPTNQEFAFEAQGGTPPYTFAIAAGGGSIVPDTGLFTAPATEDEIVIQVTDDAGDASSAQVSVVQGADSLVISPATASILVNEQVPFTASGGTPPYSYTLFGDGSLAGNVYTAPATSGTATITVTDDASHSRSATVTVAPDTPLSISPSAISVPTDGSVTFSASGGVPPYSYSESDGSGAASGPDNENYDYSAPSSAGAVTVTVTDSDSPPTSADATVTVFVPSGGGSLELFPTTVTVYTNSSVTFTGVGGTGTYTYSIDAPADGTINATTGKYTAPASAATDTIRVADGVNQQTATVSVLAPLTIAPASTAVTVGGVVNFTATGGAPPYFFNETAGSGVASGADNEFYDYTAPGAPGAATVTVTDSASNTAHSSVTITAPQPLAISPSVVTVLESETVLFVASGGTGNKTFSLVSGSGSITVDGLYVAPPTETIDVVAAEDAASNVVEGVVYVVAPGPLGIHPPNPEVEEDASVFFSGYGGDPPYTITKTAGSGTFDTALDKYTANGGVVGSDIVEIKIVDSTPTEETTTITILPASPSNVFADGAHGGPQDIEVTWTDVSNAEDQYRVERKTGSGGTWAPVVTLPANTESYVDTGLSPNTLYFYRLFAVSTAAGVESFPSGSAADVSNP